MCRLAVFALLVVAPSLASAQAQITGTVVDTSGAVLPGVTVEASSAALIERTRASVTDAAGQYRLVALRPGVYVVTFTVQGFSTHKREGIEPCLRAIRAVPGEVGRINGVARQYSVR